jgi:hypothetical protein
LRSELMFHEVIFIFTVAAVYDRRTNLCATIYDRRS